MTHAAVDTCVQTCVQRACSDFFWVYTQKWNTEPRRNSMWNLLRTCRTVFPQCLPHLDPPPAMHKSTVSLHPSHTCYFLWFLIIAIIMHGEMVLICVYLMVSDVESIFSCTYWPFYFFSDSLPTFNRVVCCCWILGVLYMQLYPILLSFVLLHFLFFF